MSEEFKLLHSIQGFLYDYAEVKSLRGKERVKSAFNLLRRIETSVEYFVGLNKECHAERSKRINLERENLILAEWLSYTYKCPMRDDHQCVHKSGEDCQMNKGLPISCWLKAAKMEDEQRHSKKKGD